MTSTTSPTHSTTTMTNRAVAFVLGFLVFAAYWPSIGGPATTPRWIVIFVMVPLLLCFANRVRLTLAHAIGFFFVAWCAISLTWSVSPNDGIGSLIGLVMLAAAFAVGSQLEDALPLYRGAALGMAISSVVVIGQWLDLITLPAHFLPAATFVNSGNMGEAAALVFVACLFHRIRWGMIVVAPALVLSGSHGAWLAVIVASLVWLWTNRRRWTAVICTVVLMVTTAIGASLLSSLAPNLASQRERLAIWTDSLQALSSPSRAMIGYGIGSYWETFPSIAKATDIANERPAHAHNELIDIAFETGLIGVGLFLLFAIALCGGIDPSRLILITLAVEACFAFPLRNPATAFLGVVVAGLAARDRSDLRSEIGVGRDRVRAWLSSRRRPQAAV